MRKLLLILPGLVLAGAALVVGGTSSAQAPEPTSGTLLASEIGGLFGGAIGPDGAFYVVDTGTGGTTVVESPEGPVNTGLTGRILRIDPATGTVTTAASNIPSVDFGDGAGSGLVDVAFIGSTMYYLLALGGAEFGFPSNPVGVYKVNADGTSTLVADLGAFALANPSPTIEIPTGNPFGLAVRGADLLVTDGNANRVLKVTTAGAISVVSTFGNVVPTGIVSKATGPIYVTQFSAAPHDPGSSSLVSIDAATGVTTTIDTGTQLIGVDFAGDVVYVVSMGDQAGETDQAPAKPFTGTLYRLTDGNLVPIATNFMLPTALTISGNTAFITTLTGEVWKVENLSSLAAITPTPTATPTATATASPTSTVAPPTATVAAPTATTVAPRPPATGSGTTTDGSAAWLIVASLGILLALSGGAFAVASTARERSSRS